MNEDVINLKDIRDWKGVSQAIKAILVNEIKLPESSAERFLKDFHPVYTSFQFQFSFNVPEEVRQSVEHEVARFQESLKEFTMRLFLDRLQREIKWFCDMHED